MLNLATPIAIWVNVSASAYILLRTSQLGRIVSSPPARRTVFFLAQKNMQKTVDFSEKKTFFTLIPSEKFGCSSNTVNLALAPTAT